MNKSAPLKPWYAPGFSGGELYVFADHTAGMNGSERIHVTTVPPAGGHVAPMIFTLALQLLAYHVAVLKGTDVDQPRNLAKECDGGIMGRGRNSSCPESLWYDSKRGLMTAPRP